MSFDGYHYVAAVRAGRGVLSASGGASLCGANAGCYSSRGYSDTRFWLAITMISIGVSEVQCRLRGCELANASYLLRPD